MSSSTRTRRALRGALLASLVVLLGACSNSASAVTTTTGTPTKPNVAPVPGSIFVANDGSGSSHGSVTAYAVSHSGNVHPVLTITRGLNVPWGLAFDASGDLWVANSIPNTVVEYRKSELAKASPAPSVTISSGPDVALDMPAGLVFDSSSNLWVGNIRANFVTEYTKAELSRSGSPAPRVTITNASLFSVRGPYGLAVDPSGDLWVEGSPSASADAVCKYPKAQLTKPGPPAPSATIYPGYQLWDFTFDSSGNLWVPEFGGNAVAEYTKAELTKSGSPPPYVAIRGSVLSTPQDLAFDSSGDLWVLNNGDQALVEYTKAELAKSASPTPARTIKGAATGLNNPSYLAIEP